MQLRSRRVDPEEERALRAAWGGPRGLRKAVARSALRRSGRVAGGLDLLQVARAAVQIAVGERAQRANAETQTTPPRVVIDLTMTPGSVDSRREERREVAQAAIGVPVGSVTPGLPTPVILFAGNTPAVHAVLDQEPLYDREDYIEVASPSWNEELMAVEGDSQRSDGTSFFDEVWAEAVRSPAPVRRHSRLFAVLDTPVNLQRHRVSIYEVSHTPIESVMRDLEHQLRRRVSLRNMFD